MDLSVCQKIHSLFVTIGILMIQDRYAQVKIGEGPFCDQAVLVVGNLHVKYADPLSMLDLSCAGIELFGPHCGCQIVEVAGERGHLMTIGGCCRASYGICQ